MRFTFVEQEGKKFGEGNSMPRHGRKDRKGSCSLILKKGATKSVCACNTLFAAGGWRVVHTFRCLKPNPKAEIV
jgi:hypothetical protein